MTPGLRVQAGTASTIYLFLRTPVHQDVNEAQLAPRRGIALGLSRTF